MQSNKTYMLMFLMLLLLSITFISPSYAEEEGNNNQEANETTEGSTEDEMTQEEFIQSLQPKVRSEVTIKVEVKKVKVIKNYNLAKKKSKDFKPTRYVMPFWLDDTLCGQNKKGIFFMRTTEINCGGTIFQGTGLNQFSSVFFEDIIMKKIEEYRIEQKDAKLSEEAGKQDEEDEEKNEGDDKNLTQEDTQLESVSNDEETEDELGIGNILGELSKEDGNEEKSETEVESGSVADNSGLIIEEEEEEEEEEETEEEETEEEETEEEETEEEIEKEKIDALGIMVKNSSSGDELGEQVDDVLMKILHPENYEYLEEEKEVIEEVVKEEVVEKEEIIIEAPLDKVFPEVSINGDIEKLTRALFGKNASNIIYSTKVEGDDLALSSNYLAIALDNFRKEKEVLKVSDMEILIIKGSPYYKKLIQLFYINFLKLEPSKKQKQIVATQISSLSFSFYSYTSNVLNDTTRNVFRNKLIVDFQKIEKKYTVIIEEIKEEKERIKREKEKTKKEKEEKEEKKLKDYTKKISKVKIMNFLLKRKK